MGKTFQKSGKEGKTAGLNQEQPSMPTARTEFSGIHFTECDEKHGKNQCRLQDVDKPGYVRLRRFQGRNPGVNEVRQCSREHGDGESPVFNESDDRHVQIIMNGCAKLLILLSPGRIKPDKICPDGRFYIILHRSPTNYILGV